MNYGISVLFRAIPLLMALFCFGYGFFVFNYGVDSRDSSPDLSYSLLALFV